MKNRLSQAHFPAHCFLALLWLLSLGLEVSAQSERADLSFNQTIKVEVDLVTLSFSVRDKHKRYVENLRKEDLVLLEDEVSQEIAFFDSEPVPLSLAVLVDTSESTLPFFKEIEATSQIVTDLLYPQDEAAVIAFSDVPTLLQGFTSNRNKVLSALEQAGQRKNFSGATNINDSIYLAAKKFESARSENRRVILLISDGKGNRGERERALKELRASEATLIEVGLGLTSKLFRGAEIFNQWVKETGGRLLLYSPKTEFRKNLRAALEPIRNQYWVGYVSSNRNADRHFRHVKIEIAHNSPLASNCVVKISSHPF